MKWGKCGVSCTISLPGAWVSAEKFEQFYAIAVPQSGQFTNLTISFPKKCSVMIDAALRILSLANYSLYLNRNVTLSFDEYDDGVMGYLNRIGFFDFLPQVNNLTILPSRPFFSNAKLYAGNSGKTVEIGHVEIGRADDTLPTRLAGAIAQNASIAKAIEDDIWLILAELIQNIPAHSNSPIGGYAAFQAYTRGSKVQVAISDSGLGVLATLRPVLAKQQSPIANLSDIELLLEIFRRGISRHGGDRGHGLKRSAEAAIKYRANLDIRLANSRIVLVPSGAEYVPHTAVCQQNLPFLPGTHFCFSFPLDNTR